VEGIAIRKASLADSEPIARPVSELGYPTSTSQMQHRFEAILDDDQYQTFVACEEGHIGGFVGTRIGPLYEDADIMVRLWCWPLRRTGNDAGWREC
jgi:hypothetical protein